MESPPKKLKLHTYFRSSASWRVRIVLNLKGLEYEPIFVHLLKDGGQQKTPEYEKINPMKHVPALDVDGTIIVESMAICEFLEEIYPSVPLLPKDFIKKAQVRAFCEMINSGLQPLVNLKVLQKLDELKIERQEWLLTWLNRGLDSINKYLEGKTGKYCFGDEITLADAFMIPMVAGTSVRFGADITPYTNLTKVIENLKEHPAFKKASPPNQPDAE